MRYVKNKIVIENLEYDRAHNLKGKPGFCIGPWDWSTKKMTKKLYKIWGTC